MKKNTMMRIASLLLIAVLLSTSIIGGTFAKYTSTYDAKDQARVARWGFGTTDINMDLFDTEYTNVKSANGDKLIAPGVEVESTFKLVADSSVAPEVAYKITVDASQSTCGAAIIGNENIHWTLNGTDVGGWENLKTKIAETYTKTYDAGASYDEEMTIGFNWVYSTDATQDGEDTAMGNASALEEVKLLLKITAEQVEP